MTDTTNTQVAGTDGASLENLHHSNNQVLNDGKEIKEIQIHSIRTDGTQTRVAGLNRETIDAYAEDMNAGASFPPLVVYFDGTDYFLGDGSHRLAAAKQIGCNYIKCEVRPGRQRDALRWALQANKAHGLKRTNDDKRFAIRLVLSDEEWGKLSANVIADMCGVTAPTVASVIKELAVSAGDSDSTVKVLQLNPSKRLGADGKWRPATHPKPQVSEAADDPDHESDSSGSNLAQAATVTTSTPAFDNAELEAAGFNQAMAAVVKAAKSGNGKPVVCGKLIEQTLANLGLLSRQLRELDLGLWKKHDPNMSEMIRDVREAGHLKQVSVKGPAPQLAPF